MMHKNPDSLYQLLSLQNSWFLQVLKVVFLVRSMLINNEQVLTQASDDET